MTSSTSWPLQEIRANLQRGRVDLAGLDFTGLSVLLSSSALQIQGLSQTDPILDSIPSTSPKSVNLSSNRCLWVIVPTQEEAYIFSQTLSFFFGFDHVHLWSEHPSPYETLHFSRPLQGQRISDILRHLHFEGLNQNAQESIPLRIEVMSCLTASTKVPPPLVLQQHSLALSVGQEVNHQDVIQHLTSVGYERVTTVYDPCSFAVRGDLIDLYPPDSSFPYRLEFWGDELESIRLFDSESQRRFESDQERSSFSSLLIPPVRFIPLNAPFIDPAIDRILDYAEQEGLENLSLDYLIHDIQNKVMSSAVEKALPGFFPKGLVSPLDLLQTSTSKVLIFDEMRCKERMHRLTEMWLTHYKEEKELEHFVFDPTEYLSSWTHLIDHVKSLTSIYAYPSPTSQYMIACKQDLHLELRQRLDAQRTSPTPLLPLMNQLSEWNDEGYRVLIACPTASQKERLEHLLTDYQPQDLTHILPPSTHVSDLNFLSPSTSSSSALYRGWSLEPGLYLHHGPLAAGLILNASKWILLSAAEIFGQALNQVAKKSKSSLLTSSLSSPEGNSAKESPQSPLISSLRDLEEGDYVVHMDYGIGIYRGFEQIKTAKEQVDCMRIEFAKNEIVHLPIYRLHLIQKFVGSPKNPPKLNQTKSKKWTAAKTKAKEEALEQAEALLQIYAQREASKGYAYSEPERAFAEFEARFPHTETLDQEKAIRKIIKEMCASRPMDHLLCGDVGFGKTEVAMRAAMKALLDRKQVAVLVPTTVLAAQHEKTFKARFAYTPFRVAQISRFISKEKQKVLRQQLKKGEINIIIGTHGLLNKSVQFADLGLLILDEEHRFGVRHKERLKELRASLDVLSMTATPIPRTLHLSLSGLRSMSIIATPPTDRLSVNTVMCRVSESRIRHAILNELQRGGQVFFVHNRVQTMTTRMEWLKSIVPEARIDMGHGKMKPEELEEVMWKFTEGAINVLVCSTIIETGIDIPRANTMFIDDAHRFGLAQLYQLRGRVGRSHERAHCYLLIPHLSRLNPESRQRLEVIQRFTDLGSGFHIATHDLELRGAGEILGTKQKGQLHHVGLDLYAQLLEESIRELKGETPPVVFKPKLRFSQALHLSIPSQYMEDHRDRLMMYRRVAQCAHPQDLLELRDEITDRFGPPPPEVLSFLNHGLVQLITTAMGVEIFDSQGSFMNLELSMDSPVNPLFVIEIAQRHPLWSQVDEHILQYDASSFDQKAELKTAALALNELYGYWKAKITF